MKTRRMPYLLLIVMAMSFVSFRWPVNNGTITSTFCESRWDHFHDGIDMTSIEDKIYLCRGDEG